MVANFNIKIEGNVTISGSGGTKGVEVRTSSQNSDEPELSNVYRPPRTAKTGSGEDTPLPPGSGGEDSRLSISFTVMCPCEDGVQQVADRTKKKDAATETQEDNR